MAKLSNDYINWTLTLNASQTQKEIHNLSESSKELEKSNKVLRERMGQLVQAGQKNSKEYRELNKAIKENNRIVSENKAKVSQLKSQLDLSAMSANQLARRARELRRELMNTSHAADPKRFKELQQQLDDVSKAYRRALDGEKGWRTRLKEGMHNVLVGGLMEIGRSALHSVTSAFTSTFSNVFSIISDFEAANSKLAAILGTTAGSIGDLTNQARELGAATSFSASEVTSLQIELAKLGFIRTDIMAMTPEVLKFAKAVDTDLGSAAALTGAALRIFGLDAKEAGRAVSTMAIGTTTSALSFTYLQNALSTVGPVAASFGFTIEETTALLGALANSGFDASSAATATRNIMLAMADPAGKLSKALGQPVRSLDDLVSGLQRLNAQGVDLARALDLTDKRSVAAFQTFLNGASSLSALRDGVTDCQEAFDQMSAEMGNNVRGSLSSLSSALEGLVLQFYNAKGPIKVVIDALTIFVSWIGKVVNHISSMSTGFKLAVVPLLAYTTAVKLHVDALLLKIKTTIAAAAAEYQHKVALMASTTGCSKLTAALKILYGTLLKNPYALIITAIAAATAAVIAYTSATSSAAKAQQQLNDIKQQAIDKAQDEIAKIDLLIKAAEDETLALTERQKAVDQLNQIIPEYNAQIDATTGKYKASKKALDSYIDSLIRQYEVEGAKEKLQELGRQKSDATAELRDAEKKWKAAKANADSGGGYSYTSSWGAVGNTASDTSDHYYDEVQKKRDALTDIEKQEESIRSAYGSDINASVANQEPTPTVPKSHNKGHSSTGQKKSPAQERLALLKEAHEAELAAIRQYGYENNAAQAEIDMMMLKEAERYATERYNALEELAAKTAQTDTEERQRIGQGQRQAVDDMLATYQSMEQLQVSQAQKQRDTLLQQQEAWHRQQQDVLDRALAEGEISQGQHDAYLLQEGRAHADRMLEIQQQYADDISSIQIHSDEQRLQLQKEADEAVAEAHRETLRQAAAFSQRMRELTASPIGTAGQQQAYEQQVSAARASYDAMIEIARDAGLDVEELERHKQQKLLELAYEHAEQEYQLQSQMGVTWQTEFEHELAQYRRLLDQELISDQEYQKKKLQLQVSQAKKYFDYYSGLSSSMVSAIQQAEIDAVEAKYDVLIREAENNGEETAALEEQKENEKLEIQKKYADTNFAIKVSQIIADTAVAVMKAYADLGPVAGTVAAALIAATGAAQLVSAKAERDKIKHLQPKKTAGKTADASSSAATAERVLTGYADGGYTGQGPRYEVAGVVHRGEYVVPKPIMSHPAVVDAVAVIEAIRAQSIRGGMPQFAEGGFTSPAPGVRLSEAAAGTIAEAADKISAAAESIQRIRAYVVYSDIEKTADTLQKARKPFTRNSRQ